jgi:hypothetical protein
MKQVQIKNIVLVLLVAMLHYQLAAAYVNTQKTCRSTTRNLHTGHFISGRSVSLKGESSSDDGANGKSPGLKMARGSTSSEKAAATEVEKKATATNKKNNARGASKAKKVKESETKSKKGTRKVKRKAQKDYWSEADDEAILEFKESEEDGNTPPQISNVHFKIRGNPRPLRRHRTARGIMYNPSEKLQSIFRETVQKLVFTDGTIPEPLFEDDRVLVISMVFRLKRARHNFIGNKAGPGRMRDTAPHATSQTRTDVDNLTKFVLDAMNLVLYEGKPRRFHYLSFESYDPLTDTVTWRISTYV